jgi:hypothetical protein
MSKLRVLLFTLPLALAAVACGGSQASSVGDDGDNGVASGDDERALLNDPEIATSQEQELGARPKYTTRSVAIRGEYRAGANDYCAGGFDACDRIVLSYENRKLKIKFGYEYTDYTAEAFTQNGVVVFSTGEMTDGDCDDPGCGNMTKISGVIYPVRVGNAWVPRVKATYSTDFPYPDEPDAPEGIVKTTIRLQKQ